MSSALRFLAMIAIEVESVACEGGTCQKRSVEEVVLPRSASSEQKRGESERTT
jgi:hypothetical protein